MCRGQCDVFLLSFSLFICVKHSKHDSQTTNNFISEHLLCPADRVQELSGAFDPSVITICLISFLCRLLYQHVFMHMRIFCSR